MPSSRSGVLAELEHYAATAFRSQLTSGRSWAEVESFVGTQQGLRWFLTHEDVTGVTGTGPVSVD